MGAVTVIVIGLFFSMDQITKGDDAVFWQDKICRRGNARIQKGDGESLPAVCSDLVFFGGEKRFE